MNVAEELAAARVEYAVAWQMIRPRVNSDMAATQATIEQSRDIVTVLTARLKATEIEMEAIRVESSS